MRTPATSLHPGLRYTRLVLIFALSISLGHADVVTLSILHTADLHGRVACTASSPVPDPADGGWLRIAAQIRAVRRETPHVLLVDAGDTIQGSPESHRTRGREMVAALERAGYDAWIPGNHEFDWGWERLRDLVENTSLTVLAANLGVASGTEHPFPRIQPYTVRSVAGIRVAIVGLTTPGLPRWFLPELLGPIHVMDSLSTLRSLMPVLRAEKPDLMVLVLHQGYRGGRANHANQVADILRRFPEFDVVLGGHSHEFIPGRITNGILYAQSGYHGRALGRVDVVFDRTHRRVLGKEGRLLSAGQEIPEDPAEAEAWSKRVEETRAHMALQIGHLVSPLEARSNLPGQSGIERLLRAAIGSAVDADIVLHGVLNHESLAGGVVTEGDLWRIVPYENRIGVVHWTLRDIREVLEEVLAQPKNPRFMGVSGLIVHVDPAAPAGRRVVHLRLPDGRAAHGRKRFRVAMNSYTLASAGGRYPHLRERALDPRSRLELTDHQTRDALREYFRTHPTVHLPGHTEDGYRVPAGSAP